MAQVPVMNPPKKRRGRRRKAIKNFKRKAHRKVRRRKVRALKNVARKKARRVRRRRSVSRKRVHKNVHRKRRKTRRSKVNFNPFGSELITLGNPGRRKRRKHHMARSRKRHRRRHALTNPFSPTALLSQPKQMFTKEFATEAVSTAAGFIAPGMLMGYLPVSFRDTKVKFYASKVLVIAATATAAGMVSKKASRFVLIGGGVSLLLDLWTEWQARSRPAAPAGTSAYYGDDNMGAYYGDDNRLGDDVSFGEPAGMY